MISPLNWAARIYIYGPRFVLATSARQNLIPIVRLCSSSRTLRHSTGLVLWCRCELVVSHSSFRSSPILGPLICSGGRWIFTFCRAQTVVSFVVILLQFPVDLRGPTHNTDAQNIA